MNSFERWWNQDETRRRFGPSMRDQEIWDAATVVERERCKAIGTSKPSAWLVPSLVDFTNAKHVHFSRADGCMLTDEELKEQLAGTVQWHPEIFSDGDSLTDRDGAKHFPIPLFRALTPSD